MRSISATLMQNLGTGVTGLTLSLDAHLIQVGALSHAVDDQLAKITPGDCAMRIEDHDGTLWTWLQAEIQSEGGLLPPFFHVVVDAEVKFLGIVQPSSLVQDEKELVVEFVAQDWSVMLANQALGILDDGSDDPAWRRPLPNAIINRSIGSAIGGHSTNEFTLRKGQYLNAVYFLRPNTWVQSGDFVTTTVPGMAGPFLVEPGIAEIIDPLNFTGWGAGAATFLLYLKDFQWPAPSGNSNHSAFTTYAFTRQASALTAQGYYQVAAEFTPDPDPKKLSYVIALDTVDGIVPGDKLGLQSTDRNDTWTVLNVDAERMEIITKEPVTTALTIGMQVYFTSESLDDLVFEDARAVLARACRPYGCDLSRFSPAMLPVPVLAWLPLRPFVDGDSDLTSLADVEPGLGDLRVLGSGTAAWDGSPETGWVSATATDKRAWWTGQTTTMPSSLMPDENATLNAGARRRNRSYGDFLHRKVDNGDGWDPATADTPGLVVVHDYLLMRRLKITGTSVVTEAWTGSAWGSPATTSWPSANAVQSACIYPGLPGAVLAYAANETLEIAPAGGGMASVAVPAEAKGGVLTTTPWAPYLVSAQGYGRVVYSGGTLSLEWVTLSKDVSVFWPNTLCGLDQAELVMLGYLEAQDSRTGEKVTETWLFRLAAIPVPADASASVLWSEKISDGKPSLVGAFRDPLKLGRVFGQMGGRLFQVSRELPFTLERFKPSGMNASELIEHVCQVHNAVAIPRPDGQMEIVSRQVFEDPYVLSPDRVTVRRTRAWGRFFSIVRVSNFDDSEYFDAKGQDGGLLLEVLRHPLVWTLSGCAAMAKSWSLWFGEPRQVEDHSWFYADANTAPPWEVLPRYARVRLNGTADEWQILKMSQDLIKGEAKVTLIQVFAAGYGQDYSWGVN